MSIEDTSYLKTRDFPRFNPFGFDPRRLSEKEGTIEFKIGKANMGNLFELDKERIVIFDELVGLNTRLRFDRTFNYFRFIRVRFDTKKIEELRIPITKFDPTRQLHFFLIWRPLNIELAIGNVGLNNLVHAKLPIVKK